MADLYCTEARKTIGLELIARCMRTFGDITYEPDDYVRVGSDDLIELLRAYAEWLNIRE